MELTPINAINQIITWFVVIMLEMLFVGKEAQVRKKATVRIILGNVAGICFVLFYFLYYKFAQTMPQEQLEAAFVYLWWGVFYFLSILFIWWWFDITLGQAMIRCIMALCLYSVGTTIVQNLVSGLWFPDLMAEDMLLYLIIDVGVYTMLGIIGYLLIVRHMGTMQALYGMDTPMMYGFLSVLLIFCNIVWDISNGIFKHTIASLMEKSQYSYVVANVQYFCAFTSMVFSVFVLGILFLFYRISWIRQEESMLQYLQSEKEKQYEYSKQSMDVIHQKCHDLKRQIQALRLSNDTEKERLYQETQKAADFFDYVVKTDNEMLNTILTEKGLICHHKRIRMTCTVKGCQFEGISVIDLYTIFSNAIDNAIECVEKYEEEEKRVIAINIFLVGDMNCIMIENYFEGELHYQGSQLITSKQDTDYHGFGVRSIRMLAQKYKGDIRVSHVNHTFSLQIMLQA